VPAICRLVAKPWFVAATATTIAIQSPRYLGNKMAPNVVAAGAKFMMLEPSGNEGEAII